MADDITFQSTTLATPASGVVAATDDVAGKHYQRVKITDGTADSTNHLVVDSGGRIVTKVSDGTDTMLVNTDGSINVAGSFTTSLSIADQSQTSSGLTTATTAYSDNDVLGAGWTFTSMCTASGGFGAIVGAQLIDKGDVTTTVELFFADQTITFGTDNSAVSISDADAANLVPVRLGIPMNDLGGVRVGNAQDVWLPYKCNATSLFVYARTLVGHNFFAAATDLVLRLHYLKLS